MSFKIPAADKPLRSKVGWADMVNGMKKIEQLDTLYCLL
jgi:hypothetical protein